MGEEFYYVRKEGYLGNALLWWGADNNSYTCDINKARKFTYKEAEESTKRSGFTAYPCNYIDFLEEAKKTIIDCQYVDNNRRLFKNKD